MNQLTKEYIERLPEPARYWAEAMAESDLCQWAPPYPILSATEAEAVRSAVADLRQFEEVTS